MDNVSIHTGEAVAAAIEAAGHVIKYLPPYSPDFNPIELTFAVLKAWMKRNHWIKHQEVGGTFGSWLRYALNASNCDRFAAKQFRHAADGKYLFEDQYNRIQQQIRALSTGAEHWEDVENE